MTALATLAGSGSKALSYFLGSLILAVAAAVVSTAATPGRIVDWLVGVLGLSFLVLLAALIFTSLLAWTRIAEAPQPARHWIAIGQHAANGIATLALTYTLLGISLGIGSLAEQELSPATIQDVIRQLTAHFSMAFMTTVLGLPIATLLRALLAVTIARRGGPEARPPLARPQ